MLTLSSSHLETAILESLMAYRRLRPDAPCGGHPCPSCFAPHREKIRGFLSRNAPIHLVLPAFPAKSPNPRKTLGPLPDLAERLALRFLRDCCRRIGALYSPGARITLCSDGRVFSDLVQVPDHDVTAYAEEIERMLVALDAPELALFRLDDVSAGHSHAAMRHELMACYATPMASLRERVHTDPETQSAFNGIARFLFEDLVVLDRSGLSRNALRNRAHALAYETLQRSMAWGDLVAAHFPDALRLSIHPQPC